MAKQQHPAAEYMRIRGVIFRTYHNHGMTKARHYLDGYKNTLGPKGYIGLKAELIFYANHFDGYNLSVAADVGDFTDFTGIMDGKMARFDVTTNIDFKELSTYEAFQKKNREYFLAVMDPKTDKLIDIVDINFPFCDECGGRMVDIIINYQDSENLIGVYTTQRILSVCLDNPYEHYKEIDNLDYHVFKCDESPNEYDEEGRWASIIKKEAIREVKFFKKVTSRNIVGCGEEMYYLYNKRDGEWITTFDWVHPIVSDYFPGSRLETTFERW